MTCFKIGENCCKKFKVLLFFKYLPSSRLLPVLGPLERNMTPTLDTALLCSSRAGSDLGHLYCTTTLVTYSKPPGCYSSHPKDLTVIIFSLTTLGLKEYHSHSWPGPEVFRVYSRANLRAGSNHYSLFGFLR